MWKSFIVEGFTNHMPLWFLKYLGKKVMSPHFVNQFVSFIFHVNQVVISHLNLAGSK